MDILDTLISTEVTKITSQNQSQYAHRWTLVLKVANKEIRPLYIDNLRVDRHYHKNYADELLINATFSMADYQYNILPYKGAIEATLTKIAMTTDPTTEEDTEKPRASGVFRVQLMDGNSAAIAGDHPLTLNKEMSTKIGTQSVTLQLFNPVLDLLRKKTWGGNVRDNNALDLVGWALLSQTQQDGVNVNNQVRGVNIDASFQPKVRQQISIPHNTPLVEIPHIVDKQVGGLHPAQMRYYLQSGVWFVYPILDHQRFMTTKSTLTIIKVPKTRMPSLEKTFRVSGVQVVVITTRDTSHHDNSESQQINTGNGVRFADSTNVMGGFYKATGNKVTGSNKENMSEVSYEPKDKDNFLQGGVGVTDKYNHEYAKLAIKSGAYIQTQWENANVDLLYPGMPVRYIFQDGEDAKEMYGTLNAVESLDYRSNTLVTEQRFTTLALLTIFVTRISPVNQSSKTTTDVS